MDNLLLFFIYPSSKVNEQPEIEPDAKRALPNKKNCIAITILKLVAEMRSGAYLTYVSILNSSQMPKEHCYAIFTPLAGALGATNPAQPLLERR